VLASLSGASQLRVLNLRRSSLGAASYDYVMIMSYIILWGARRIALSFNVLGVGVCFPREVTQQFKINMIVNL